jgi:hypothetical protein
MALEGRWRLSHYQQLFIRKVLERVNPPTDQKVTGLTNYSRGLQSLNYFRGESSWDTELTDDQRKLVYQTKSSSLSNDEVGVQNEADGPRCYLLGDTFLGRAFSDDDDDDDDVKLRFKS